MAYELRKKTQIMDNVFLFTGKESYLISQQIKSWKEAFILKHGDMNLLTIDGRTASVGEIISDIIAAPFLADKRLIFIENLPEVPKTRKADQITEKDEKRDESLNKLIEAISGIPETSIVVFTQGNPDKRRSFYKKLIKLAVIKEFNPMQGGQLIEWIKEATKKAGASINSSAADHLISLTGTDLWRMSQEVNKLSTFTDGNPIVVETIDNLVVPNMEANIFHLTDAIGAKNHKKAIQNLHRSMSAGDDLHQVFYMIVRQFRLFLQVGSYVETNPGITSVNIASSLKLHPFVAKNTLGQVRRFKMAELKKAHEKLLQIDLKLKTSKIRTTKGNQEELALAIERFIIGLCYS